MKVGLLADIHGNSEALGAVLASAKNKGVGLILVAGDLIGYYLEPLEVFQQLADWKTVLVRGNHEQMFLSTIESAADLRRYSEKYGPCFDSLSRHERQLISHNIHCMGHPERINLDGLDIVLAHGSPFDIDHYVYPNDPFDDKRWNSWISADVIVLGHTHYSFMRRLDNGCIVINPGSVGQPRNRIPGAHWAILDTESGGVDFIVEQYDYYALANDLAAKHPDHPYLHEVLVRR